MAPDLLEVRPISRSYGRRRWWSGERPRTLARGNTSLRLIGHSPGVLAGGRIAERGTAREVLRGGA